MTEAEEQRVIDMREFLFKCGACGDDPPDEEVLEMAETLDRHEEMMRRAREIRDRRRILLPYHRRPRVFCP
jgi:hypothetical protein